MNRELICDVPWVSLENTVGKIESAEKNKLFRLLHIGGAPMHCHGEKEGRKYQFTGAKVRENY